LRHLSVPAINSPCERSKSSSRAPAPQRVGASRDSPQSRGQRRRALVRMGPLARSGLHPYVPAPRPRRSMQAREAIARSSERVMPGMPLLCQGGAGEGWRRARWRLTEEFAHMLDQQQVQKRQFNGAMRAVCGNRCRIGSAIRACGLSSGRGSCLLQAGSGQQGGTAVLP